MVAAVRVLCGTGLAGNLQARNIRQTRRALCHNQFHTLDDGDKVLGVNAAVDAFRELVVGIVFAADSLDNVRFDVVAVVGDDTQQVGHLQWGGARFALTDTHGNDGVAVPVAAIFTVEVVGGGNGSRQLVGQVSVKLLSEAQAVDVIAPSRVAFLYRFVFLFVRDNVVEGFAEECVARMLHGSHDVGGTAMVAADGVVADVVATAAVVGCRSIDDAFL